MIIWIKEYGDVTIDCVSKVIKKDIKIKKYDKKMLKYSDTVLVSVFDDEITEQDFNLYNIILFEKDFDNIISNINDQICANFDYYYIKHKLKKADRNEIDTIITGSSYGLFGVDEKQLSHQINLSLASQDIYYSLEGAKYVLNKNNNIRNIVICCGYYYFYSDLSRTSNEKELKRVPKVYYKLYGRRGVHNCLYFSEYISSFFESNIFDISLMKEEQIRNIFNNYGYFDIKDRRKVATKEWDSKNKNWIEISELEKNLAGKRRAEQHNKNKKRIGSLYENVERFEKFADLCEEMDIKLWMVVTPVTKEYKNNLDKEYKKSFYDILNRIKAPIQLIDFQDIDIFVNEDFNDTDHLSEIGAKKMTKMILDIIE